MIDSAGNPQENGKTRILILGAGVMQGPALRIAAEMGLQTVAADADPNALYVSLANRFEQVDLKDKEGMESLARSLLETGSSLGIMTAGTDFSATVAWAAERLGLPGIAYETALDASDKERMRRRFKAAGVPSPEFVIVKNPSVDDNFTLPFPMPVVVKPVDNMGARGCRRVNSPEGLRPAVSDALKYSRSGRAIVEEYMEGPEFSVDALVYRGEITMCGIADRHIFFPPYFIEMGHTMPSSFDQATIRPVLETFIQGIRALGITNGAAKGDIKLTPKGPMIGEIAARLSGGYMSGWTYPYSSGVLPARGAIEIAMGKKPTLTVPEWDWTSAERAFISIPGKVLSVHGLEKARVMPFVRDVFSRIKPGSEVSFPENNVTKCGNVISAAPCREDAVSSAEKAVRSILIRLEAPNEATDAFLAIPPGEGTFPPDAFGAWWLFEEESHTETQRHKEPQSREENYNHGGHGVPRREEEDLTGARRNGGHREESRSLRDYMGRSVQECLDAVRALTGLEVPDFQKDFMEMETSSMFGRSFWQAFIRGGYQGAVYYIDKRMKNGE